VAGAAPACGKGRAAAIIGIALVGALSLAIYLQSFLLPRVIISYVETALEIEISGRVQPRWGRFEFLIDPLKTLWDQKIKIDSGRVDVRYGIEHFSTGKIHLVVTGHDVDAQLLGDWVSLAGGHSAVFKDLYADLIVGHDGLKEIRALRAESPTLQFRFGEASNRHLKETHEA